MRETGVSTTYRQRIGPLYPQLWIEKNETHEEHKTNPERLNRKVSPVLGDGRNHDRAEAVAFVPKYSRPADTARCPWPVIPFAAFLLKAIRHGLHKDVALWGVTARSVEPCSKKAFYFTSCWMPDTSI